ncbi:MAG: type II toxin-antitoxin system RelE/ParE family toxin [Oribacterium sp.]|jgi:plasmid stabilization system protein ParE|nr:type II toxin-antitoxin system RelE/ParE family toxin [Oribacterium sp.]MDY6307378.1 type II toxin-antitoxin system RelE/ParE family toxin [Oribacterium sp.]MDY6316411.1 type II toxin-antitoxin system RelE/ParE family toxin [Oribacterium sp.]
MVFEVKMTPVAEKKLDDFLWYLIFVKKSEQAARNVYTDFLETKDALAVTAGSLGFIKESKLKKQGFKRINFKHHNYFMIFHLDENRAIVDDMFHGLQDYENRMR